jgi:hypothetical protein
MEVLFVIGYNTLNTSQTVTLEAFFMGVIDIMAAALSQLHCSSCD